MANGGIYDHLAGGFHRYSVTADWHVPHFEKMLYVLLFFTLFSFLSLSFLPPFSYPPPIIYSHFPRYDQAQLVTTYLDAFLISRDSVFSDVAEQGT